ncbi:hypothetical protein ACHAWF_008303 [Thalassiosira exigua]
MRRARHRHRCFLALRIVAAAVGFRSPARRGDGVGRFGRAPPPTGSRHVPSTPRRSTDRCRRSRARRFELSSSATDGDDADDDDAAPSLDEEDWRAFRARLVLGNGEGSEISSSSPWAYDSGRVIEPGSIVLAKAEPDFCYFGLDQQYFHKSVMLVTYHEEGEFTKGVILNRPTNLFLGDEDFLDEDGEPYVSKIEADGTSERGENSWRIWFGGDVKSLYCDDTEIVCLHSIDTELARNASDTLMDGILMTNYEGAMRLIGAGEAEAKDFWMFAGYAGWTGGQLLDEIERESWYMVSADSGTVCKELIRQRDEANADPRDAGLQTWSMLMGLIGKENEAKALSESFADLTLKEWAADAILFNSTAGSDDVQDDSSSSDLASSQLSDVFRPLSLAPNTLDRIVKLAVSAKNGLSGSILRGSSADKSPFLLSDQKYHKSILLLLQDDDRLTVGVMLNHPTTKTRPLRLPDGTEVEIPIRYGGSFGIPGVTDQPTIYLHAKRKLKELGVGEPVGRNEDQSSKMWICSEEQVVEAIAGGRASHREFACIEGFSIWEKDPDRIEEGILGEILEGKFEVVDPVYLEEFWVTLLAQAPLARETLDRNCRLASDAWRAAGGEEEKETIPSPCVYDSTVTVSELSDDALRYWIEAFLFGGVVTAAEKYSAFE